ncbi:MAG: DNA-directed RNA polymerase subunit alpha [Ignavibacteria bacterium]|jgi:DNA-directed RNA polymerase subunit alpha|nr:DNA-directed RNA polymerase subunit alpha [Ignavibacteria bacterium]
MVSQMQMPDKVQIEETQTPSHSRFIMQPLEHGYANTVGNAMRRVLLSSIPGAAITGLKITDVLHEYQSIPHVVEDVSEIILNLKEIKIKTLDKKPQKVNFHIDGPGEFTAKQIQDASPTIEVMDSEAHIATLSGNASFDVELRIGHGKGYVPAEEQIIVDFPVGMLPIDSIYTPILLVNYAVESFRVGQRTDYERLVLDVRTDGTITAEEAVSTAAQILNNHFRLFKTFEEYVEDDLISSIPAAEEQKIAERNRIRNILLTPIADLELSVRSHNCLQSAGITNIAELVQLQESELLKFRNFGRKSLNELLGIVQMHSLNFGMNVDYYLKEEQKPAVINI